MVTLPNGTELTEVTRVSCLDRIYAIKLGSFEYNQGRIEPSTGKRADCTGWVSYVWDTPDSGPGIYLHAYNTASFFTQKVIRRIDWADLLPGDMVGYCSPTSPGNGGHAAIWMAGQKRPDGLFTVYDHGSGWGPKFRQVRWNGNPDSWMAPVRPVTGEPGLAPWRYVAMEEEDMPTAEEVADAVWAKKLVGGGVEATAQGLQIDTYKAATNVDRVSVPDLDAKLDQILDALADGSAGLTEERVREIVRKELDKTKLAS